MQLRLQKYLAEAGVASRRGSEEVIRAGRVAVNGRTVREMGSKVDPKQDRITVDGAVVKARRKLYIALHKPAGYVSTRRDTHGRRTVSTLLPKEWSNLYTVGRLDYNTEGLIFLTNDGDFALRITHPRYGIRKKYQVAVEGEVQPSALERMIKGVFDGGERLKAEKARLLRSNRTRSLVELELAEGKNREARRLFEAQGYTVTRLTRLQIGPIKLGELPVGRWRTLSSREVAALIGEPEEA